MAHSAKNRLRKIFVTVLPYATLLIVSLFYVKPYLHEGFFSTHDGTWAVVRLAEMVRELKDIQIPPRWSGFLNHGYGYPLFNFTYPLPYYVGAILAACGFGLTGSIKALFVLSVFLSGITMYLLAKELTSKYGGLIAALLYISAPYRMQNLYIRGSSGESLSFILFPLLCYLAIIYIRRKKNISLILLSLTISALVLTHNVMALLFFPVLVAFIIFSIVSERKIIINNDILKLTLSIILGLLLTTFFTLPVLIEKKYIALSIRPIANINEHFLKFSQYFIDDKSSNLPSFQLGIAIVALFFLGVITVLFLERKKKVKYIPFILFSTFSVVFYIFISNRLSYPFWKLSPLPIIDFPWRVLTPLTFAVVLPSAFSALRKIPLILAMIIAFFFTIINIFSIPQLDNIILDDLYYYSNDATTTSNDELMPIWVNEFPRERANSLIDVVEGKVRINKENSNSKSFIISLYSEGSSKIEVNAIYFPGWVYEINLRKVDPIEMSSSGGPVFVLEEGENTISGKFQETNVRKIGNFVSLLSSTLIFSLMFYPYIKKRMK